MKQLAFLFLPFLSLLSLSGCGQKEKTELPLISTELSFNQNPSAYWQIGYTATDSLDMDQFHLSTVIDTSGNIGIWHPSATQYYPYLGQNHKSTTQIDPTNSWAAKPGEIVMEGSGTGQYAVLRFTAPVSGKYRVKAVFEGVHSGLSTTDVHVLLGKAVVFSDSIIGYGGDSTFHAITGARPSVTYEDTLQMQKDGLLNFAIGYGSNKSHFFDTSGLLLEMEIVE